jgi:uncharacterized protein YutE (UPF0331/DUF86 family)
MVDIILIKKLLADLREKRQLLNQKKIKDFKTFKNDPFLHNAVQHIIEIMVEICIDIGNHIIADKGWKIPASSREIFETLEQHGAISEQVKELAKKMIGFRNIIVHMYEKVDLEEVYGIYKRNLKDFDLFAAEIEKFIRKLN